MLNLSAGLLPEHLSLEEVELLRAKFDDDWFHKLGYKESEHNKPIFPQEN